MIVIDASALAKLIFKEEGWEEVAEVLKREDISIDYIIKEVTNSIWRRLIRNEITSEEARVMYKAVKEILGKALKVEEELPYMNGAFEISLRQKITIYDSLYIAVAKKNGFTLLTADHKQAQVASTENVQILLIEC